MYLYVHIFITCFYNITYKYQLSDYYNDVITLRVNYKK